MYKIMPVWDTWDSYLTDHIVKLCPFGIMYICIDGSRHCLPRMSGVNIELLNFFCSVMSMTKSQLQEQVTNTLFTNLHQIIGSVALGPIVQNGQIRDDKLHKPR